MKVHARPNPADKMIHQALLLQEQGDKAGAAKQFRRVLQTSPTEWRALYSLGLLLVNEGKADEALKLVDRLVAVRPQYAGGFHLQGFVLECLGRYDDALAAIGKGLAIEPNNVDAYNRSGLILNLQGRRGEAGIAFQKAVELDPNQPEAISNLASILFTAGSYALASAWYGQLLKLKPDYQRALGAKLYTNLHLARWEGLAEGIQAVSTALRSGKPACSPMALMALGNSASDQLICARLYSATMFPAPTGLPWTPRSYRHDKLRVAYVSADFRQHPVGHLMAGVISAHDRERFEVTGISLGRDDDSSLRKHFETAFDRFIDARAMGLYPLITLMRELEIDIAVDLSGFTEGARTELFKGRVAPVQVGMLGYPGTLGSDFMDYIVADPHVIPPGDEPCYTEQVVRLPHTYLPTDATLQVAPSTPTREEAGLPTSGFVFCCFNHIYKLNAAMFDVWMALLAQVPGSVLWLSNPPDPVAKDNLRLEAQRRGVDPARLVFAGRVPQVQDHLARYRLAGLFLDTSPYNAHTTAADALFVGLPVVTCSGNTFPSRVAGSLLHSLGLPELITTSLPDYQALALKLATNPAALAAVQAKVQANRSQQPLFNTSLYTRHLEAAYTQMMARAQQGEAPAGFTVPAQST